MTDKEFSPNRYPDLFDNDEMADPALERLITDLEIIYPPTSYPASLSQQLRSVLETHVERNQLDLEAHPALEIPEIFGTLGQKDQRRESKWRRRLNSFIAAALTMLLISTLLLVLYEGHLSLMNSKLANSSLTKSYSPLFLYMMSATTGWERFENAQKNPSAIIAHTTDGGAIWQNVTPRQLSNSAQDVTPRQLSTSATNRFYPVNATTAWMAGSNGGPTYVLLRTIDSGQAWQSITLPTDFTHYPIDDMDFLNKQFGWIMQQQSHNDQQPNIYWLTKDAGKTWQKFTSPSATIQWGSLTLFDAKTWAFTTAPSSSSTTKNGRPTIYITHNAGATWHQQVLPVPAGLSFFAPLESLHAFSASDATLAVADGGEDILIYTTHNGGISWQFTAPLSPDIIHHLYGLGLPGFANMSYGYMYAGPIPVYGKLPSPNYLITTNDSGQHWKVTTVQLPLIQKKQPGAQDTGFGYGEFISPQIGWLVISNAPSRVGLPRSGIYKTVNGGKTWTAIPYQIQ